MSNAEYELSKVKLAEIITGMAEAGWAATVVDIGEGDMEDVTGMSPTDVVEIASQVDESRIYFTHEEPDPETGIRKGVFFVIFGNGPDEVVADLSQKHGFCETYDAVFAKVFPEDE